MPDLTVIIVNWNARDFLESCLESLRESMDEGICDVTVVDNASSDDSREMVRSLFPRVDLIESESNLGFAKGNNLGIARASTPFILLLNSDTIVSKAAIEGMLEAIRSRPDIYILTCGHVDGLGNPLDPTGKFPTLRREFSTMTGMFKWPMVRWLLDKRRRRACADAGQATVGNSEPRADAGPPTVVNVDWVNGACMLMRREIGGLDERYFFYGEDIDICMRVRKLDGRVGFVPSPSIVHHGGGSSEKNYLKLLTQYMYAQTQLFEAQYGPASVLGLRLVHAVAGVFSVVKWALAFAFCPPRRPPARTWLRFWTDYLGGSRGGGPIIR